MSIYDKTGHIDQLTEWWENAEEGVIEKGDTVINRSDSVTTVYVATVRTSHRHPNARILSRAPEPKPAWHDAVAVIATAPMTDGDNLTGLWFPEGRHGYWESPEGYVLAEDLLHDVTPLIEAKVTDEAIDRVLDVIDSVCTGYQVGAGEAIVSAALGLEIK